MTNEKTSPAGEPGVAAKDARIAELEAEAEWFAWALDRFNGLGRARGLDQEWSLNFASEENRRKLKSLLRGLEVIMDGFLARAETAEAEVARLREALEEIAPAQQQDSEAAWAGCQMREEGGMSKMTDWQAGYNRGCALAQQQPQAEEAPDA